MPSAEPSAMPSGSASAAPSAAPKVSSGRPAVLKSDPAEITDTFGTTPGAKLQVGEGAPTILVIPEGSLDQGYNISFKVDPKGKTGGPAIGKIFRIEVTVAGENNPATAQSAGPPFLIQLPLGDRKDINLAYGEIGKDDKGGEKITWKVYAPKKTDTATKLASFELATIGFAYIHGTTKAP
jgi:hypothetical protein